MMVFSNADAVADAIAALERPLLLVFDCDGVLAPITDHADDSVLTDGIRDVLADLAHVDSVDVAVLSGRSLDGLAQFDFPAAIALAGSYGAERHGRALDELTQSEAAMLSDATQVVDRAAAIAGDGAWVEHKPTSVVLHVREAATDTGDTALAFVAAASAELSLAACHEGSRAFELMARAADKGSGLDSLRAEFSAASVVYIGDDVPDEDAFERLLDGDIGVKVGPAPTAAGMRVSSPDDVLASLAGLVERLAAR